MPYVCSGCHRGFWKAELSTSARELYRPLFHDWGLSLKSAALREEVDREREDAHKRGTSALVEHLPLLSEEHLRHLQQLPLEPAFAVHVGNAIKGHTSPED